MLNVGEPFVCGIIVVMSVFRVACNVLALGEEADFEALNFLPVLNLIRSTKLQLTTEPAFLPNACYVFVLFCLSYFFVVKIKMILTYPYCF